MAPIVVLQILVVSLAIYEAPVRSFLLQESKCQIQPRVSTCETCTGKGKNAPCRNTDNFGFGKYCFRENVHNASGLFFTKGVAKPEVCQQKMHLSSAVQQECKKALPAIGTVCYDCCFQSSCSLDENYCNNLEPIPTAFMPYHSPTTQTPKPTPKPTPTPTPSPTTSKPTTHTTRPTTRPTTHPTTKPTTQSTTTPTTQPTTTPTTQPTTTPTTQPTTTPTTQPTTTPTTQPTTTPTTQPTTRPTTHSVVTSSPAPAGRLCQVCEEQDGTKCTENDYQTCDISQPYCMNTLITDSSQYIVKKKCASEVDCRWDYWIGTRGDSRCNTTTGFATEIDLCHYCCQTNDGSTSPCNIAQLPTELALFDKPSNTQKKCIVGDTIFGFHEDVCESEEMYCLNTVRYKKNQIHPVEQVQKGCALEAECRGQWWFKTRNQPECLSLHFNNLMQDEILCHYCCISNDTDYCNGPNIPHQLYSFLPPTGSPPLPNDRTTNIPTKIHASTTTPKQTTSTTTTPTTTSTTTTPTTVSTTATSITTTPTTISTTTTPATTVKVTVPPPKTTPAITELPCNGSSSLECKDDPLVDCKSRDKQQGLCRNPNELVIDHCPLTCGLCSQYCANQIAKLTTAPPTTTTAAPIVTPCQGSTAVVCKDDPMVNCQLKNVNEGLCQSSNALVTDYCPVTCGKCDQYCANQIAKLTTAPPTTTTTAAPTEIPCQGSTTVVCKDDPMVDCQSKNVNEGLCQVSNQLVTDHCPVTCGKCDQYCAKNVPAGQSTRTSMAVTLQLSTLTAGNASQSSSSTTGSTSTARTISRSTTISISKSTESTTDITTSTAISSAYTVNPTTKTNQQTTTISHAPSSSPTLTDTTTGQQTFTSATTASATTATTTSPTTATSTTLSATTTSPPPPTSPTTTASPTTTKTTKTASYGFTASSSTASRVTTPTVNPVSMTWVTVPNARPASTTETLASCYVCSGPDFLCESFYHLQTCPSDKQFCMNRVTNNMDGSRTMTRSCATESQCRTEWWQGSSSKNECMGYDASGITLSQFGCAFCCTTSGCNKNVIPSDLYIGSK